VFGDSGGVEIVVQVFKDNIKDRNIEKTASIALLQLARLCTSKILSCTTAKLTLIDDSCK